MNPILVELFSKYDFHSECKNEIYELLIDHSVTKDFTRLFQKNTEILEQLTYRATYNSNFEKLQGEDAKDLYVMKFKSPHLNARIIYTYIQGKLALLLCCFYERSDSEDTYHKYIPIANARKKEMEG